MLHIFALGCLCLDHCLSDVYSRNHKVSFRECKDWSHCSNLWNTFHLTAVVSSSSLIKITELVRHNKERLKYTAVRSIASKPWENGFQSVKFLTQPYARAAVYPAARLSDCLCYLRCKQSRLGTSFYSCSSTAQMSISHQWQFFQRSCKKKAIKYMCCKFFRTGNSSA